MRILLTNDDGVHAPGLAIAESIAHTVTDDVWIVAPEREQSGTSRAMTLAAQLRVRQIGPKRFAVDGTPSDCVLLALHHLIDGPKPDLALSGVNAGQNIAEDVTFSGTVAGAMQCMQFGIPAIALSQAKKFRGQDSLPWETAMRHGPDVLKSLIAAGWPAHVVLNVNFPDRDPDDVAGVEITRQGFRDQSILRTEQRTDLRGHPYFLIGYKGTLSDPAIGTDLRAIYEGRISITPLHIDLTEAATLTALQEALGKAPAGPQRS